MAAHHPYTLKIDDDDDDDKDFSGMRDSVNAVEKILGYEFKDKKLLEKALTHSSFTKAESYQRLEFVGDAALGLAIARYAYIAYPDIHPVDLSKIKDANISTEKLARVAVRIGLYNYVRHNTEPLDHKVKEFLEVVQEEDNTVVYGGAMKAPKVLADIVESVVAAVYVDLQFDLQATWLVVRGLLEPLITLDMLQKEPQPVSMLFDLCQKNGQQVVIKHPRKDGKNIASVYIDGNFIVSVSSDTKENAKLHAATAALKKLAHRSGKMDIYSSLNVDGEIECAKNKLYEVCLKKKWSKPSYRIEKKVGPHASKFVCSVSLKISDEFVKEEGEEKLRLRDAEGSAASVMLHGLRENNFF